MGPLDADPSPRRYLRHRGRSPAPRRARRSPAGSSASASPPRAGEEPCVAAGRTMPRQPLSGTVLLAAALLLAGKAPTTPVVPPHTPLRTATGSPRRVPRGGRRAPAPVPVPPPRGRVPKEMLAVWRDPPPKSQGNPGSSRSPESSPSRCIAESKQDSAAGQAPFQPALFPTVSLSQSCPLGGKGARFLCQKPHGPLSPDPGASLGAVPRAGWSRSPRLHPARLRVPGWVRAKLCFSSSSCFFFFQFLFIFFLPELFFLFLFSFFFFFFIFPL